MKFKGHMTAALCAAATLLVPVQATATTSQDEAIRRLDIMLMVTSLRCRFGSDNFQPQYEQFATRHLNTLNGSARRLQGNFVSRLGPKGAARQLDQISVSIANQYGQGHPWLGCGELKRVATDLANNGDPASLHLAAAELLAARPQPGNRFAAR